MKEPHHFSATVIHYKFRTDKHLQQISLSQSVAVSLSLYLLSEQKSKNRQEDWKRMRLDSALKRGGSWMYFKWVSTSVEWNSIMIPQFVFPVRLYRRQYFSSILPERHSMKRTPPVPFFKAIAQFRSGVHSNRGKLHVAADCGGFNVHPCWIFFSVAIGSLLFMTKHHPLWSARLRVWYLI